MSASHPEKDLPGFTCPLPLEQYPQELLAHGGGGRLMHQLIDKIFVESFRNPHLESQHDGAVLTCKASISPSRPTPTSSSRSTSRVATSAPWP